MNIPRAPGIGRRLRQLIFATSMGLALIGCGGGQNNASSSSTSSTSGSSSSTSSSSSSSGMGNICADTQNIALGLNGTSSSLDEFSSDLNIINAFDGDNTTRWSSAYTDSEWLALDLGSTARICGINLSWEAAYGSSYQLQISDNGTDWTTIHTVTGGDGGTDTLDLSTPVTAQHVRMRGTARGTEWGYSLWEFEIIGAFAGPPAAEFTTGTNMAVDAPVQLDATRSKDPGGAIVQYQWDFGDGRTTTTGSPTIDTTYSATGTYDVTLTVTDNDGYQDSITRTIRILENVASGKMHWDQLCSGCHETGKPFIRNTAEALAAFTDQAMPPLNPNACTGTCATDVAAYIMSWIPPTVADCDAGEQPLERSLRLLTNTEYQNTINDLFNLPTLTSVAQDFPGGVRIAGYDNNAKAESVNESRMGVYWEAANVIASAAAQADLGRLLGCTSHNQSCANTLLDTFGLKVLRRPLTAEEKSAYSSLFLNGSSFNDGAQKVIKGLLISPYFLYRPEQGIAHEGAYRLSPYETATLLAYTFTGSTPDMTLLTAAGDNQLQTREQLVMQVQRLLQSPKADRAMVHFARQWLHVTGFKDVTKDTSVFPDFTTDVKNAMSTELDKFMSSVLLGSDTAYGDLYESNYTFATPALATYYGLGGGTADAGQTATNGERGGILKLGAWLATQGKANDTSPVLRGVFVRKYLLCQHMPLPDASLEINIPEVDPNVSTRERFSLHSQSPVCSSCHQFIDDLGFGFDTFDGAGKFNPYADDYGVITGLSELTGSDRHQFKGVHELSAILADADGGAACVVEQFQMYATGQEEQDDCNVRSTATRWKNQNYSFQELWNEIVSADTFLMRR